MTDYERLQELQAHIERLRKFIESNCYDAPGEFHRRAVSLLSETPAQSLAEIQAQAVNEAVNYCKQKGGIHFIPPCGCNALSEPLLEAFANQLRQQAKEDDQ